jgi:signal transduction histidine kinase
MEPKNPFFDKTLIPENYNVRKALNGKSPELPDISDNSQEIVNIYTVRLQELEKRNAELEKIALRRRAKIYEIIANNKKYISILAHDLKGPFSSIYGVLGMIKELIHENKLDEIEEYIDIASGSALNTNNLIENHLAWATAQNKETSFSPIAVNLASLVNKEIENGFLSVKLKKISMSHSIPANMSVMADIQLLRTIMRNLINNAIKFTNPGGNIVISARKMESMIEITVKDDGKGIHPSVQQELFLKAPLHTAPVTNTGKGKGLGLLLCKEFVNAHGGEIHAESQLDKGSSFIFTMPKHDDCP